MSTPISPVVEPVETTSLTTPVVEDGGARRRGHFESGTRGVPLSAPLETTLTNQCHFESPGHSSGPNDPSSFAPTVARRGVGNMVRQLGLLLQWNFNATAEMLPMIIIVQLLMAVLTVFGYSMFLGEVPLLAAQYLVAGSVTVQVMMVGLVMAPQSVSAGKQNGSLSWFRTLPLPRLAFFLADVLVYGIIAVPAAVLSLFLAQWHLGVTLSPSVWIIPAALLISLVAATIGYSMALLLPPQVAALATQVIVFIILMFSPINFPAANMPAWLAATHEWLPFAPMAELMRSVLMADVFAMPLRSAVVLAVWTLLALAGAARVLTRRV